MASIFDYLQWRCDVPFSIDPFNEVDNLVLSELAYTDFKGILSMEGPDVSLAEVCKAFFERHTHKEILADKSFTARAPLLMESMLEGARYRDIRMLQYLDETDSAQRLQLAAMTFLLPDDSAYVAFRGTDSTVVGWKEDFYFSFLPETEGQRRAIRYLNQVGAEVKGTLRVGGHSKGGNLAIYTAVNLPAEMKERLLHVSNYDGPGFPKSYIKSHDFASVLDRLYTFIPQESMIGRIHEHPEGFQVIESTENGIQQHDVYSWVIGPTLMMRLAKADDTSEITYRAIQNILTNTSPEQRKEYVDRMFDLLMSSDANSFSEVFKNLPTKIDNVFRTATSMTAADHKENTEMMTTMVRSFLDAALSYHEEKLPDFGGMLNKFTFDLPDVPVLEKLKEKL